MGIHRFAHASNVRLDAVLRDLGPVPDAVRDTLRDATLTAFESVVTTCLDREVGLLLLAGNTFDAADTGLRARAALRDGLECLDEAGIPTVIVPGDEDPVEFWSRFGELPGSASVLGLDGSTIAVERHGEVVATVSDGRPNRSLGHRTRIDAPHDVTRIVVTSTELDFGDPTSLDAEYVALVGEGPRRTVQKANPCVHHAGHAESRSDAEQGLGGLSLVELTGGRLATKFVPTGSLRRERCNTEFERDDDPDRAAERLVRCLRETGDTGHDCIRLVEWHVRGDGDWFARHRTEVENRFAARWAKVGDGVVLHRWNRAVTPAHDDALHEELLAQVKRFATTDVGELLHRVAATAERSRATDGLVKRLGRDLDTNGIVGRAEELATDWLDRAIHEGHAA